MKIRLASGRMTLPAVVVMVLVASSSAFAQPTTAPAAGGRAARNATPKILKEPGDWRFEALPIPPTFAPGIKLTGSEEARFAPGMFDTASETYFTYAIAVTTDGATEWSAAGLKDFLEQYFRGLSSALGQRKGMKPDVAAMVATVDGVAGAADRFSGQMIFFDSFTDGRKVTLNIEAQTFSRAAGKQYLILLISPSATDSATWTALREVGKKAAGNVPG